MIGSIPSSCVWSDALFPVRLSMVILLKCSNSLCSVDTGHAYFVYHSTYYHQIHHTFYILTYYIISLSEYQLHEDRGFQTFSVLYSINLEHNLEINICLRNESEMGSFTDQRGDTVQWVKQSHILGYASHINRLQLCYPKQILFTLSFLIST